MRNYIPDMTERYPDADFSDIYDQEQDYPYWEEDMDEERRKECK